MKRVHATFMIVFMLTSLAIAQDQLENPGFEQWEDILVSENDTIREPVEWSSLKTSDNPSLSTLAPVVCKRSSDAHSGAYSVELTNVLSLIVANGVVTNGLIHPDLNPELANIYTDTLHSEWNTPFTARPDSLAGWFKYSPQSADTLQVKAVLHRGFGKQPDEEYTGNWIGMAEFKSALSTGSEWVRFSTPFIYFNENVPEYILVVLNSGNEYSPVAGSIVLFDDLEMIYNSPQASPERLNHPEGFVYAVDYQYLVIQGMEHANFQTVKIHEMTGRLVWEGTISSRQIDISSANLGKGIYVVTLTGKSHVFSQKIMWP